jgi:hypothetical protein
MIIAVDDREVMGEPLSALRNMILGNQGSQAEYQVQSLLFKSLDRQKHDPGAGYKGDFVRHLLSRTNTDPHLFSKTSISEAGRIGRRGEVRKFLHASHPRYG